jgi:hypothetical protein
MATEKDNKKFVETPSPDDVKSMFPKCRTCLHYLGVIRCKAFAAIPDEILFNEVEHDKVRPDQMGEYVYTKVLSTKPQ